MTRTALIVVDVQNDFCTGPVATARYRQDPARLDSVTTNAARAVELARDRGVEVVFVRFVGDVEHQGPGWRRRNERDGRTPTCLEGTWGAEFHKVAPKRGEVVVTKHACFDAFLAAGFEQHLLERGIGHLVFAGVYADVCVDSTARTAFQKGWHITLLVDCTTSLLQRDEDTVRFMTELYGARTTTHDRLDTWCDPLGREDERCSVTASR
ncbi:cysteine hydrolase [Actinosynnema sp. NPDC023587]|uniref:cysteine hydrolase family protein n=1 Tax=Actinosynnema sp. NPDC023587 TaxID=3154695 RepID=UPI0033CE8D00